MDTCTSINIGKSFKFNSILVIILTIALLRGFNAVWFSVGNNNSRVLPRIFLRSTFLRVEFSILVN